MNKILLRILVSMIGGFIFVPLAFAATGPATIYKVTLTKLELYNGSSWVTVFSGTSSTLDIASVSSGQSPGIFLSSLTVPDGTYTQCRATPSATFTISGNVGSNYTKSTNGPDGGCAMGTAGQQGNCTVTISPAPSADTQDFSATPITVVNGVANHKVRVNFDVSNALQTITGSDTEIYPNAPTVTMSIQ